jgi:hypothetical protein
LNWGKLKHKVGKVANNIAPVVQTVGKVVDIFSSFFRREEGELEARRLHEDVQSAIRNFAAESNPPATTPKTKTAQKYSQFSVKPIATSPQGDSAHNTTESAAGLSSQGDSTPKITKVAAKSTPQDRTSSESAKKDGKSAATTPNHDSEREDSDAEEEKTLVDVAAVKKASSAAASASNKASTPPPKSVAVASKSFTRALREYDARDFDDEVFM